MLPNRNAKKELETACTCGITNITLRVRDCSKHQTLRDRSLQDGPPAPMLLSKESDVALPYTLQS